ncbi:MAG: hypothetical protein JJ920_16490 [Roseitalea sp.]|jgi:hypothetical protein|nr:hypothetical protein [Roseitalea sp.]MBO6722738.1 hypothetical protein [Roseitalea sp.]MBO6744513.1 hypothetical protein [Roseitalea sp.]
MKELVVVLTLMGCDDAGAHCDYIDTPAGRWPSMAACQDASEALLTRIEADYPSTAAQCEVLDAGAIAVAGDMVPAERPARAASDEAAIAVTVSPPTRRGMVRRWVTVPVRAVASQPARIAGLARTTADRVTGLLPAW